MRKVPLSNNFDSAQYIFNIVQNFPNLNLIIDVRPEEEYEYIRLARSINLPFNTDFPESLDIQSIRPFMRGETELFERCKRFAIVIVYSPPGIAFAREMEFLLRRHKCREVYILDEEFGTFAGNYPFLCRGAHLPVNSIPKQGFPSEIIPFKLYVGNYYHASSSLVMDHLKITHIINATRGQECKFEERGIIYYNISIEDNENEDISSFFEGALAFIENAFTNNRACVLVHCAKGVSRSVTIIIMYLMATRDIEFEDAFEMVKKHRYVAQPNDGFVRQLKSLSLIHI